MKKIVTTGIVALVLSGCTSLPQMNNENEETADSVSIDRNEQLSEEEQKQLHLLDALPDQASAEDWNLLLVNKEKEMPQELDVSLTEIQQDHYVHERIVTDLEEWLGAAQEAGHDIHFGSGYRSIEHQEFNYNWNVDHYMSQGMSEEDAQLKTEEYIAPPGSSEHHTGLAVDLLDEEWVAGGGGYSEDFDEREAQHWLEETMQDYGFILRYPKGKEEITGYSYEPWHFRYVGKENARFIVEHALTLEEYLEQLEEREAVEA